MTNDTSTLNGALTELGELMADNLVTMGVTDATASDGLTTLANKILDVPVTPVTQTLTLSSDKSILSYADSETATLTATLTGGTVSGQTIEFYNGSTSMGTATTNSSGVATMTYSSTGNGDVVFSATGNNLTSQPITVEDCKYWNDGSSVGSLEIPSGASVTSDGDYLTIASTTSEKLIYIPVTLANSDNWEFSVKIALKSQNKVVGLIFNDNSFYVSSSSSEGKYYCHFTSDEHFNTYATTGDIITFRRENGVTKMLVNGNQLTSKTVSHKSSFKCGFYTYGYSQYVDDIKLKAL